MEDEEEEDDLRVIKRLRKEIEQEREITKRLRVSSNQWNSIVREILSMNATSSEDESDWRIRCHYQRSFNDMLGQRIKDLKREVRVLRTGDGGISIKGDVRRMSVTECRLHIRHMETDLTSMKSLRCMYERQLDHESMAYAKTREKRSTIIRDIFFLQKTCMRQQENFEKKYFQKLRDKYGGNLFRPSKLHIRRTRPDLTAANSSQNTIKEKTNSSQNTIKEKTTSIVDPGISGASLDKAQDHKQAIMGKTVIEKDASDE